MATEHDTPREGTATAAAPRNAQVVEFEDFIEAQLSKTRGHVRSVDIAGSLMLLAAGTLGLLLVAVMFDHWIVSGGLGFWGRALFLAMFVIGATTFLATQVLPLLVRKINPLYAAQTIERSQPTLKNALVNFLFFRADRSGLNPVVYEAVEEQAATRLAGAHVESAVDRSKLIHLGYLLLGILLVCAVYAMVSPKDLFQTAGRIAMPWAEITAPTQTRITEIVPGAAQAFRGQQVAVSARIQGLPEDGKAVLYYSTADGQIVDRAVELAPATDGYKYAGTLPGGEASLQQDVTYRIEAGDAISPEYRIAVVAAPTIFVRSLEYNYPSYTGLVSQRVEREGDIKAIEGTEITLDALANGEIQTAYVDFACDGKPDLRMRVDGDRAKVSFRLKLNEDRTTAEHPSYQVTFTNAAAQQNPQPVRHQIEVTRDLWPEIEFIAPRQDEIDLPLNGELEWEVVANDPDFKLALVKLSATRGKQPLFDKLLLSEPHRGQFVAKFKFQPEKLGLKAGDVVEYSALAEDNKNPGPNRAETAKRRVRIVSPDASGEQQDRLAQNDQGGQGKGQPGERGQAKQGEQARGDQPANGEQGKQGQAGKNGPADGPQSKSDQQQGEQDPGDDQKAAEKGKPGDAKPKNGKQDDGQQDRDKQDGAKQDGGQQGDGQQEQGQAGDGGQPSGNDGQGKSQDGKGQDGKQPAADEPVSSDGSNDGDAIERILKHREQQQQDGKQGAGNEQKNEPPTDSQEMQNDPAASPEQKSDQPGDGADQASEKQAGKGDQQKQQSPADSQQKPSAEGAQGKSAQDSKQQGGDDGAQGKGADGQDAKDKQQQGAGDKKQQSGQGESDGGKQPADKQPGDRQPGEKSSEPAGDKAGEGAKPAGDDAKSGAEKGRPGDKPQGGEMPMKGQDRPAADPGANSTPDKKQPGDAPQGEGAQSKDDPTAKNKSDKPGDQQAGDKQRPDAKGGDGNRDKGKSGAGQQSQDKQGSPSPEDANQPRDKAAGAEKPDSDPKDPNQAQSPSNSKRESDSQGQDDGDRSGGGKRGGGQKSNKPGTGGAGENTAADDGAGAAEEAGDGETSDRAGDDKASSKPTGKSGSQQGQGSEKQAGDSKIGESSAAESAAGQPANQNAAGKDPGEQGAPGGAPAGGNPNGKPPAQAPADAPYRSGPEVEDKANLEYARRASDLAISHLKDELAKDQPDRELLDKLGWTRDDLENFIKRWDEMRQHAQAPDERGQASRRELDDTLRSLGLRPRATSLRANDARNDKVRGMRESRSTAPPPEYAEQTKAYTQGTARGEK